MYLEYYGLLKRPFHITPDPEFLYLSPSHKEALAVILYGVENGAGFMMITGAVGLGKTTILRSAMQQFDRERVKTILVFNPCLSYTLLARLIYEELGLDFPDGDDQYQLIIRLHSALIEECKKGNNVVLIIDEAQNMPSETLDNLRMLSNIETSKDKLLQVILIGQQPELDDLLNRDALRQLRQRIVHRAVLVNLTLQESIDYINHRLEIALGVRSSPFTKPAIMKIAKHCGGVPRRINIVCDNALVSGFGSRQNPIKPAMVREVIRDLEGEMPKPWKRWVLAPIALLLLVAVYLFFHSTSRIASLQGLFESLTGSRETSEGTASSGNPKEALSKAATPASGDRTAKPNDPEPGR